MTEVVIASLWVWFLIDFIAGEILGMIICAICAGWFDKIFKEKMKAADVAAPATKKGNDK